MSVKIFFAALMNLWKVLGKIICMTVWNLLKVHGVGRRDVDKCMYQCK